jgi:hypothetical protein
VRALVWILAVVAVGMLGAALTRAKLKTAEAPLGIVSLELAGTPKRVQTILSSWRDRTEKAKQNIYLDFPFIAAYATALALSLLWARDQAREVAEHLAPKRFWIWWAELARLLALLQVTAGLLDVFENIGMLCYFANHLHPLLVRAVSSAAAVKFAIVGLGLAVFGVALAAWLALPWRLYVRARAS